MFLVTKRIEFCYGHRLLDYDGVCRHLHGHNAVVEVDVRAEHLDGRNMVPPLPALGEPIYLLDSNPTVERIAQLIFDTSRSLGLDVAAVRVWETPTSCTEYRATTWF